MAILFAGGPAPAANAVISTAAVSFLRNDIEVVGILYGYSSLAEYRPAAPAAAGRDYIMIDHDVLQRTRNTQGIMIGTARTNPGKHISEPAHLDDPERTAPLRRVYEGALLAGRRRPDLDRRRRHAEDGQQVQAVPGPLPDDASGSRSSTCPRRSTTTTWASTSRSATSRPSTSWPARSATCWPTPRPAGSYFLAETMGRSAGWLAYGAAIAGEASLVISVEDITGKYRRPKKSPTPTRRPRRLTPAGDERGRVVEADRRDDAGPGRREARSTA